MRARFLRQLAGTRALPVVDHVQFDALRQSMQASVAPRTPAEDIGELFEQIEKSNWLDVDAIEETRAFEEWLDKKRRERGED